VTAGSDEGDGQSRNTSVPVLTDGAIGGQQGVRHACLQIYVVAVADLIGGNVVRGLPAVQLEAGVGRRTGEITTIHGAVKIRVGEMSCLQRFGLKILVQLRGLPVQQTSIHGDGNVSIAARDHDVREDMRTLTFMLGSKLVRGPHVITIPKQEFRVQHGLHAGLKKAHKLERKSGTAQEDDPSLD
jgi:hypothetical protein